MRCGVLLRTILAALACAGAGRPAVGEERGTDAPVFRESAGTARVRVHTSAGHSASELALFADDTLRTLRRWFPGGIHVRRTGPYDIYLCPDVATILDLEEAHGLPRSEPGPHRTFEFRGGFYADVGLIAVRVVPGDDPRWLIAHELAHAVVHETVGRSVDPLDEGLADEAAALILGVAIAPGMLEVGDAHLQRRLPTLRELFAMDYWQFRDARDERRNFGLSWLLVRVLLHDDSPDLRGRFPAYLSALREHQDPWTALRTTYDLRRLEAAWFRAIEEHSRWAPVFGRWRADGEGLGLDLVDDGAGIAVHRVRPRRAVPYELSYRFAGPTRDDAVHGFVLGYENSADYLALVRRGERHLVLARRAGEEWHDTRTIAFDPDGWDPAELRLECDWRGVLTLTSGTCTVGPVLVGRRAFTGRVGLFACPPDAEGESERRAVAYESARFLLDPGLRQARVGR